jgi:hypothetical protein
MALSLYVWDEFCPDYSDGLAFAIAPDLESARAAVLSTTTADPQWMEWGPVTVHPISDGICYTRLGGG